jgi:hypothetical protein
VGGHAGGSRDHDERRNRAQRPQRKDREHGFQ